MFARQPGKARSWTVLVFTVLTLFCLTQNISELDGFEFKSCELSEKSMRLCIDIESPVVPLTLLFVLTLICVLTRSSYLLPVSRQQSKIRRIHLRFCRFQE
ncbi:hypothetical protein [Shewanella hanedai]|uniref:Uncharacterized protein n=1 Tax=Shewanella hanedai TaxID=25 RepID=A0A553JSA6_SHEHA|nr:hypothetical protein [Shewanella hanedai]TRY15347.1 hypothetical protein FN961_04605 [Shewanella hanedai]